MSSTYLLQSPMFSAKTSPKSSTSSPNVDCLTPAHSTHGGNNHRPPMTDGARFHPGHRMSSQLKCPPHFPPLSPSTPSSSSLRNESRSGTEHQRLHHQNHYLPHYLQHRNIFGVIGSPWMAGGGGSADLNKHQMHVPLENMELWQGGSLLNPGGSWSGGHNVHFPYPYAPMNYDVRRKNATRESTTTLKAWLYKHIKNPYPTKGEKVMLAIITKMSLTQVSTWFANARRRLKKEKKMQWSPRQRAEDDEDKSSISDVDKYDVTPVGDIMSDNEEIEVDTDDNLIAPTTGTPLSMRGSQQSITDEDPYNFQIKPETSSPSSSSSSSSSPHTFPADKISPDEKPKIWSLASMVNSDDNNKSTNGRKPRAHVTESTANERQAHAWVTPTWMFHAAMCRQMLTLQLQQQQQQQQNHHHHQQQQQQNHHHHHHQQRACNRGGQTGSNPIEQKSIKEADEFNEELPKK